MAVRLRSGSWTAKAWSSGLALLLLIGGISLGVRVGDVVSQGGGQIVDYRGAFVPDASPVLRQLSPAVSVGGGSSAIALDSLAGTAYVANSASRTVSVISHSTTYWLSATLRTPQVPVGLLVDEQDQVLLVTGYNESGVVNGTVTAYSMTNGSLLASVQVGVLPFSMAFSPNADELFVANYNGGGVSILSVSPLRLLMSLNVSSYGVLYDPFDGMVFCATGDLNGSVLEIDPMTNEIIHTIRVGGIPVLLFVNPWNQYLYVPCLNSSDGLQNATYVINTAAGVPVGVAPLPAQPSMLGFDTSNGDVIVGSNRFTNQQQFFDGNLTVISGATSMVVATIPISPYFYGLGSDNATGALYLLTRGNLTVFNATAVSPLYEVAVNGSAFLLSVDPGRGALFIVAPSYSVDDSGQVDVYRAPLGVPLEVPETVAPTGGPSLGLWPLGLSIAAGAVVALVYGIRRRRH